MSATSQVEDVKREPGQPRERSVQPQTIGQLDHRQAATHCRHLSLVLVRKRPGGLSGHHACDVPPLLHSDGRHHRQRLAVVVFGMRHVADDPDVLTQLKILIDHQSI